MSTTTAPSLCEWLELLRKCSGDYLKDLVHSIGPDIEGRMPKDFLDSLDVGDQVICFRASLICYGVTGSTQVPREMQLRAVLADQHRKDCLVAAGTGSGKTLPMALNMLLDDPNQELITLTLSPLKRLQATQERDFNTRYGIPTVVINEDTPRDENWWNVSVRAMHAPYRLSG